MKILFDNGTPNPIARSLSRHDVSFVRAGTLGLPLMIAIISGKTHRFRPLVDLSQEAGRQAGHPAAQLKVGLHRFGYLAESSKQADDEFFPGYAQSLARIGSETRSEHFATKFVSHIGSESI